MLKIFMEAPQSKIGLRRMRQLAWSLLVAGLAFAWGGLRLSSGWQIGLRRLFGDETAVAVGPFYTLEVGLGSLFWLSPFLLLGSVWLFSLIYRTNSQSNSASPALPLFLNIQPQLRLVLTSGLLALIALLHLWPLLQENWATIAPDYDEGVHMLAARQFFLGFTPHRDYFFTHPPAAIYGYLPAAIFGNGGLETIWLARFSSVVWSVGAAWLLYLCGRQLYGWAGAMVATAIFGLDGWGIFIGHQAMLEFQLNFFSLLALALFLKVQPTRQPYGPSSTHRATLRAEFKVQSSQEVSSSRFQVPGSTTQNSKLKIQNLPYSGSTIQNSKLKIQNLPYSGSITQNSKFKTQNLFVFLCGAAAGVAFLTKLNGVLVLVAVGLYLVGQRRWSDTARVVAGFGGVVAGLGLPIVLQAPGDFVKQVALFQLLRGTDGITGPKRFEIFAITPQANLTLICAWLGVLGLMLGVARGRKLAGGWLVICLWLGFSLIFFTFSRAFYLHYYLTLLPLFALAAGGLPDLLKLVLPQIKKQAVRFVLVGGLVIILSNALLAAGQTYGEVGYYPGPQNVGQLVQTQANPGETVLTLYGLDTFFAERPQPVTSDGKVLIDHYGGFYYNAYGLNKKSVGEVLGMVLSGFNPGAFNPQQILADPTSQQMLTELNARAAYTVVGDFGKGYISDTTKAAWLSRSRVLLENAQIWFYANNYPDLKK